MEKHLSRRSFVASASLAAAAAAAAPLGQAVAAEPPAGGEAPAEGDGKPPMMGPGAGGPVEFQAGPLQGAGSSRGSYPWGDTAPAIAEADIEEVLEAEVIVMGVGLAGGAAVLAAAEAGAASIIGFDKTEEGYSELGNQTAVINGIQEHWGRAGIYDIDEICNHEINEGCGWPKHGIWYKWANGIADTFDWALSILDDVYICADSSDSGRDHANYVMPLAYPLPGNYEPTAELNKCYATSVQWTAENFVPAAIARASELTDYRSFAGHRVEQFIIEDGRCAGVYAYNYATGKYKKALASKGVVVASGDYSSDPELLAYFCPEMADNGINVMYGTRDPESKCANTGEAMKAATWIGARISQFQAPMIHHMGHTIEGFPDGMGIAPFMRVNKLGRRFMNEDQPGQQAENQIELQKDMCCFMLWDDKWPEQLDSFAPLHGSVYHFLEEGESGTGKSRADVERSVEQGTIFRFDTLDELLGYLAETYGLNAEVAKASVERYNELAKSGHDDDFGKLANRMFPIETPPFYASTMGRAMALVVASGLESDEDCHVFDENRDPIPGLYVAGNAQGDRFCVQYPIAMEGVDTSMSLFYGRVAGQNVVAGV